MLAGTACQVLKYFFTDKGTWELDEGKAKMIYQWEEPGILTRYPEKKEEKAVESEIEEEYQFKLMFTQRQGNKGWCP